MNYKNRTEQVPKRVKEQIIGTVQSWHVNDSFGKLIRCISLGLLKQTGSWTLTFEIFTGYCDEYDMNTRLKDMDTDK